MLGGIKGKTIDGKTIQLRWIDKQLIAWQMPRENKQGRATLAPSTSQLQLDNEMVDGRSIIHLNPTTVRVMDERQEQLEE